MLNWKKLGLFLWIVLFFGVNLEAVRPKLTLVCNPKIIKQGQVCKVKFYSTVQLDTYKIKLFNKNFDLFFQKKMKNGVYFYFSYIGIPRRLKPATYKLSVVGKYYGKVKYRRSTYIQVKKGGFKKENITLSKEKTKIQKDNKALSFENSIIGRVFKQVSNKKLFQGRFIMPAKGRISSVFGTQRLYNGKIKWQHTGVDIANKIGTPVVAPNKARVVLIKNFKVHGKILILDHGFGIQSIFLHLNKVLVKIDDIVNKGQIVALMGKSGIATGSHVHWGVSVQNVRVNPLDWVKLIYLYR